MAPKRKAAVVAVAAPAAPAIIQPGDVPATNLPTNDTGGGNASDGVQQMEPLDLAAKRQAVNSALFGKGGGAVGPPSHTLDAFLVDQTSFERRVTSAGHFVAVIPLAEGYIFAMFSPDGDMVAIYQMISDDEVFLLENYSDLGFPSSAAVPLTAPSKFLVFTRLGLQSLEEFDIQFVVEPQFPTVSTPALTSSPAAPHVFSNTQPTAVSQYVPDLSSATLLSQQKFSEALPFRLICFNDQVSWSNKAGATCVLDSIRTRKNVLVNVPAHMLLLPVLSAFTLPAFLHMNFAVVPFAPTFVYPTKKSDSVSLGDFLLKGEKIINTSVLHMLVKRVALALGWFSEAMVSWTAVFSDLLALLGGHGQKSLKSWDLAYLFRFTHQLLGKLSWVMAQEANAMFSEAQLVPLFKIALAVNYTEANAEYMSSEEFKASLKLSTSSHSSGGHRATAVNASSSPPAARPDVWCAKSLSHTLGASATDCSRPSCVFVHPVAPTPLSKAFKAKATPLAVFIRDPVEKGKFLKALG
jgi:hypothetical protein